MAEHNRDCETLLDMFKWSTFLALDARPDKRSDARANGVEPRLGPRLCCGARLCRTARVICGVIARRAPSLAKSVAKLDLLTHVMTRRSLRRERAAQQRRRRPGDTEMPLLCCSCIKLLQVFILCIY